jgi:glycosyltransferase involved in cell wall biosynthesis
MSPKQPNNFSICYISCLLELQDTHTALFVKTLATAGYQITTIMPGFLPQELNDLGVGHIPIFLPTHHFEVSSNFYRIVKAIYQRSKNALFIARKLFFIKPDIIFCEQPDSWLIAIIVKWFTGSMVIADLRETYEVRATIFPAPTKVMVRAIIKKTMSWLSYFTDQIVHVSEERQEVYSYLHKKGIVVHYYPELGHFPGIETIEKKWSKKEESVTIIHAGPLSWGYAANELLKAIEIVKDQIPKMRFIVLGGVKDETGLIDKKLLKSLLENGTLDLLPSIPYKEVTMWLARSDIGINLVLPINIGHILAAPRKLYEYLAAGLAVVGADVPTIRTVIQQSDCGVVVNPESSEDIARGILELVENPCLLRRFGKNARKASEEKYNWENEKLKFIGMLKNLTTQ